MIAYYFIVHDSYPKCLRPEVFQIQILKYRYIPGHTIQDKLADLYIPKLHEIKIK